MKGLLGRLASQAMSNPTSGRSGVRPATSVHAQMPLGTSRDVEEAIAELSEPNTAVTRDASRTIRNSGVDPDWREVNDEHVASAVPLQSNSAFQTATTVVTVERQRIVERNTRTVERERDMPEPLLAQALAPKVVPFAGTPMVPSRIESQIPVGREEPTEVHVHIGRIEVTAAPEPAPTKKPRPAPRETLPLADYLARKGRA